MGYPTLTLGIYEKAMPASMTWPMKLATAKAAGYDFVEMSIDESDLRLGRLDWSKSQRATLRDEISKSGISITSMCLSGHRRFPLGSADPKMRRHSLDLLKMALEFAVDTGIEIILVPGYDVFYEESTPSTEARFIEGLHQAKEWASCAAVVLALENTDKFVTSIKQARKIIDDLDSIWFKLYGDVGNLVAAGLDLQSELGAGKGHLAGIHLKDAVPGRMRNVPLGEGDVLFVDVFRIISEINFCGPVMLELWEEDEEDPLERIKTARNWIMEQLKMSKAQY